MRKIKYIIAGISAAVFMVSCELDNFDGPDAQVYGAVIDAETEELIQQEIGTSGDAACVQVIEYGYAIRKVQQWKLMLNGEYRNNLVFSGTYDVIMNNGNFVKLDTIKGYRFDKGENRLDFRVIPNIRIKEPIVKKENNAIVATFKLQYGHRTGKAEKVALFAQSDQNPSNSFNLAHVTANIEGDDINFENNSRNANTVFTLTLDLNSDEGKKLKAGQKYFFRIGALPKDLGEGIQAKYNYSPVFEIQL